MSDEAPAGALELDEAPAAAPELDEAPAGGSARGRSSASWRKATALASQAGLHSHPKEAVILLRWSASNQLNLTTHEVQYQFLLRLGFHHPCALR